MNQVKAFLPLAACIAGALLTCTASQAQDAQRSCGFVSGIQKRVVEHADQGIDSLRGYITMERNVSGLGMEDVKESLDKWRASVNCQKEVAAAAAAQNVARHEAADKAEPARQVVASGH